MDGNRCKTPVDEAPWLIVTHKMNQIFCTLSPQSSENKFYLTTIVALHRKLIIASSMGWLILRERKNKAVYSLWNPITLEYLILPELQDTPRERPTCAFTSAPDGDNVCILLLFFQGCMYLCKPRDDKNNCRWVKQSLEHDGFIVQIINPATLNGDVYSYCYLRDGINGNIPKTIFVRIKVVHDGSYSIVFETSLIEKLPEADIKFKVYPYSFEYLVESCGTLYAVSMMMRRRDDMGNCDIFKAFVWSLDLSKMQWIRVDSLGNRAFLLCYCGSTWCWAGTSRSNGTRVRIEGDCLYLARPGSRTLHSYRLRNNSYAFLSPHPKFLRCSEGPIWFMPHNHTRLSHVLEKKEEKIEKMRYDENVKEDTGITSTFFSEVPSDVLISIANRLHLFDYMNLRATCKTFHVTIPPPKWREYCSFPLFMSLKNNKGLCELWDLCEAKRHTIKTPHSPAFVATIEFCKDGWLLLRIEGNSLQYFNPFTKERWELPPFLWTASNASYAFSTCPNSFDCITVGIEGFDDVCVSYFQASSGKWERHVFDDCGFVANYNSSPKYHNGAFYFLSEKGDLGVFKVLLSGECLVNIYVNPLTEAARASLNSCFLVEHEGQLISVFIGQVGKMIQIFKFNNLEKTWNKLDDLGDHMLFLSPASSFSVVAKDSKMRNRIYLPRRVGDGIVYFSLDTQISHPRQR